MNLAEIVSQFESGEAGTDAYVELRAQCLPLIEQDSANAAAYFLIANFARSYVILYEEEAVTVDIARKAKATMLDYLQRIVVSQNGGAEARLAALNAIAVDYQRSEKIF